MLEPCLFKPCFQVAISPPAARLPARSVGCHFAIPSSERLSGKHRGALGQGALSTCHSRVSFLTCS